MKSSSTSRGLIFEDLKVCPASATQEPRLVSLIGKRSAIYLLIIFSQNHDKHMRVIEGRLIVTLDEKTMVVPLSDGQLLPT